MKVRIEQSEKEEKEVKRLFGRSLPAMTFYFVNLKVQLTNEEKAIINKYNLGNLVVDQYENDLMLNSIVDEYNTANNIPKQFYTTKFNTVLYDAPITLSKLLHEGGLIIWLTQADSCQYPGQC